MSTNSLNNEILNLKKDPLVRRLVADLSKVEPIKQLFSLTMDWVTIFAAIFLCESYFNIITYPLTVLIIAARQHGLLVIMHEAAHLRMFKSLKLNNFISNIFAAYPVLITTEFYRANHGAHHRDLNTDKDPDWVRKIILTEWQYPMSKSQAFNVFLSQLWRGGYQWVFAMYQLSKNDFLKMGYLVLVLTAVYSFNLTVPFLLYWAVPLLLVFPFLQRVRSVAEHFGLSREHELNDTRNVLSGPIESFLFGPHNVNLHLAHHLFATVPHYNLKRLHLELMKLPLYANHAHNNDSYFFSKNSVWSDLVKVTTTKNERKAA